MQKFRSLVRDCNFEAINAKQNEDVIRDAFISRLSSNVTRYRLDYDKTSGVSNAYGQENVLDLVQQ